MESAPLHYGLGNAIRFAGSLCLFHVGSFHQMSDWIACVKAELEEKGLGVRLVEPDPDAIAAHLSSDSSGEVIVIDDLRKLLATKDCVDVLQRLRPVISRARGDGWRVLLLSTVPPDLYPTLAGSSILMDAHLLQGRPIDSASAEDYVRRAGVDREESVANIIKHSSGSRALLEAFTAIERTHTPGNQKKANAIRAERKVAHRVFDEIGPALCMWLDHWTFELGRSEVHERDILPNHILALRSAGVIAPAGEEKFVIFPFKNKSLWDEALGQYLESVVEPPASWADTVAELFSFERELRRDLRHELVESGLFVAALSPYAGRILDLARRDSVPAAGSLSEVRSPLDWLTLSDLLDIAGTNAPSVPDRQLCAYGKDEWTNLAREIVPIRNRIAHMRLAREGDFEVVRRCHRRWLRARARECGT